MFIREGLFCCNSNSNLVSFPLHHIPPQPPLATLNVFLRLLYVLTVLELVLMKYISTSLSIGQDYHWVPPRLLEVVTKQSLPGHPSTPKSLPIRKR